MSVNQQILLTSRRSLIVLAIVLVATAGVWLGGRYLVQQAQTQQLNLQQMEVQSEASLREKETDAISLQEEIGQFEALIEQGLVGRADREGWVEQLIASRAQLGLPNTLTYTLQPPKPLAQQGAETSATSGEAGGAAETPEGPMFHDLEFQISGIHEGELLAFLSDYQSRVKGRFRVNACSLTEPTETGLSASCTLRFFTLPTRTEKTGQF